MRKLILLIFLCLVFVNSANANPHYSNASWYGPGLYGNTMACGGTLHLSTWGVAHKYLPCGTRLRICYSRCVSVTVIDRGPYIRGRDFDLTYNVKTAIGMPGTGSIRWYYK